MTLIVAEELRRLIASKRKHEVYLTRYGPDRLVLGDSLADRIARADVANRKKADAFISIHCNGATSPQAKGFEIWTTPGQNRSDILATDIFNSWGKMFPGQPKRTDFSDGDPDKEADFTVIKRTNCPSCLVELAFITNPDEERFLLDKISQARMAVAIADGIEKFLKG